jgi:hypothetical protein
MKKRFDMQSRQIVRIIFIVFIILIIQLPIAKATVLKKLSEEQLANYAQTILIGRCTSISREWNGEGSQIFTYVTISPQNLLKGDQIPAEITIKQLGGEVGEIGMRVDEASVYEEGEEVLLFLQMGLTGYHRTIGLSQGKFSIETDQASGRKILKKKKRRFRRLKDGRLRKKIVEINTAEKIFLDEFTHRVRNILQKRNNKNRNVR